MKYILIAILHFGVAPISPEYAAMTSAEFDDLAACEAAATRLKAYRKPTVMTACLPKSSAAAAAEPAQKN